MAYQAKGKREAPRNDRRTGQEQERTEPKKRKNPLLTVLLVIAVLVVGIYAAFHLLVPAPEMVQPNITTEEGENEAVAATLQRRKGVYNILLAGTDFGGTRTDTMMVMSYDIPNKKVGVVSVPRDTLVERPSGKNPRLVYGPGGIDARRDEISDLLGIPIDYYAKVDLDAFIALVDEVGGVEFYVPCDMNYDDPAQNLSIHFEEGMQHLTGQQAMEVCRFRKNNDGTGYTDVGRTQTQQQLIVALAKKMLSLSTLTNIKGFVEIFETYVETDLSMTDLLYFGSRALGLDTANGVETATLEGNGTVKYNGYRFCYALYTDKAVDVVNRLINPYTRDLTAEDMNILGGY